MSVICEFWYLIQFGTWILCIVSLYFGYIREVFQFNVCVQFLLSFHIHSFLISYSTSAIFQIQIGDTGLILAAANKPDCVSLLLNHRAKTDAENNVRRLRIV